MRIYLLILLIVKGVNSGPALYAIENAKMENFEDQRDLPNEILLEIDMDTVLPFLTLKQLCVALQ